MADRADPRDARRWTFVFAVSIACGVFFPLLGSIGYFDPWETNYAEVAREMVTRGDYLYPYWKDAYFFSKPVLLFWLSAPLYWLIGADGPGPMSQFAELCGRLPSALTALMTVCAVFFAADRFWGQRAAFLSAVVLSTMTFWAFMARQAITDMLYVGPASAALLLLSVAVLDDEDTSRKARLPIWLSAVVLACTLPQAIEIGRSGAFLTGVTMFGSQSAVRATVSIALSLAASALVVVLHRRARDPLLHLAAVLFALSMLAKGPVGIALCGGTLVVTVVLLGQQERLLRPAVASCTALFLAIAAPWPVVMALFTGVDDQHKTWFQRFVLYDLLGRLGAGAHGDRGTFEYYVRYAGFGLFPWSAFVVPAWFSAAVAKRDGKHARFTLLIVVWTLVTFVFFSATTTKFHHYIFPLCVPAALVVGWFLDELLSSARGLALPLAVFIVLLTLLIGRDLVTEPWTFIDLFTYHYKGYKPEYYFPEGSEWRAGLAVAAFGFGGAMVAGLSLDAVRQDFSRRARWLADLTLGDGSANRAFIACTLTGAIAFAVFAVQVHFNRASQHWSQRGLVNTYHLLAKADEPLIAYQMDWKGETFYAKNTEIQVKKSGADLKKQVELPGRDFVLVQTDRFSGLKASLGKDYDNKIHVVDRSNVKWLLVQIDP